MGRQSGKLSHTEQEVAGGRGLMSRTGKGRGWCALPQLPRAKEDSAPVITPHLCLHGREHVGSTEQDLSDSQFSCLQNGSNAVLKKTVSIK